MFLNVIYSERGSNSREKEENAYMMFIDYLEECEGLLFGSGQGMRIDFL